MAGRSPKKNPKLLGLYAAPGGQNLLRDALRIYMAETNAKTKKISSMICSSSAVPREMARVRQAVKRWLNGQKYLLASDPTRELAYLRKLEEALLEKDGSRHFLETHADSVNEDTMGRGFAHFMYGRLVDEAQQASILKLQTEVCGLYATFSYIGNDIERAVTPLNDFYFFRRLRGKLYMPVLDLGLRSENGRQFLRTWRSGYAFPMSDGTITRFMMSSDGRGSSVDSLSAPMMPDELPRTLLSFAADNFRKLSRSFENGFNDDPNFLNQRKLQIEKKTEKLAKISIYITKEEQNKHPDVMELVNLLHFQA